MMLYLVIKLQKYGRMADDRAGIYRESFEGLITHYQKKGKTLSSNEQLMRDVLKELAFSMQKGNTVRLDYGSALDVAGSCIFPERYRKVSAEQVLEDCFRLGFLHKDGDEVRFGFHQSFQEYFAAVKLKDIFEQSYDISESFSQPKWEDTLVFLSEITERPDELFDDVIGASNVFLAAKLSERVDNSRVEKLCALLLDRVDSRFDLESGMAVESFAYIGDRATEVLIGLLAKGESDVRYEAAEALGKIGGERAVEPLINALYGDDSLSVRWRVVGALEEIDELLMNALYDNDPSLMDSLAVCGGGSVRWNAAWEFGEIGDERAVELLIDVVVQSDDSWMRWRVAEALGEIGDERAVELLIDALQSDNSSVRWSAAWALKSLCGPTHKEKLEPLLRSDRKYVASAAFEILHPIELKEREKIKIFKELKYLLRLDSIPGNDSDRLLKYLLKDHGVTWAERAKIRKSDDKTLIISEDKNSAEIKIDEKGKKATLKLSDGRTCDLNLTKKKTKSTYTTPSDVMDAEEMLADAHLGALIDRFKFVAGSITVVDYGCGKGAFLGRMKEIERELGKIHYIGVDISRGNRYLAGITAKKYGVADKLKSCYFMDPDEFFNKDVDIDHVFFSHVIHEIFLKYLPEILYHLLSKMKAGSRITILEQVILLEPERDFVTWSADDFDILFSDFAEVSSRPYKTGRGHELISVDLERLKTDVSLESIRKRCLEVYEHKKERVLEKLGSPDLSDDEHRYQTALLANIYSQMNEYQKSMNG